MVPNEWEGSTLIEKALQIDGWMAEAELRWLAEQALSHRVIVEIGSFLGRSTRALADNTPGVVYAVDHWYGPAESAMPPWERETLYDQFCANLHDLIEVKKAIPVRVNHAKVQIDANPDMVFIDGDHRFESVLSDIQKWKHIDGLLCGHDYSWNGVRMALETQFEADRIENVEGTDIWRIRAAS